MSCEIFIRKYEGKRAPRRPRHRWEDNSIMDLKEVDWTTVAQ
jgi:hypothetical protein